MKSTKTILMEEIKGHPLKTVALLLVIMTIILLSLLPPQILRMIIDTKLTPKVSKGLLLLSVSYLAAILVGALFDFLKTALLISFGQNIVRNLRSAMEEKLERLPLSFFTTHSPGSVTSRFSNDAEQVNTLFSNGLINLVIDLSKVFGIIISIAIFSWKLAVITLLVVPLIALFTRVFRRTIYQAQKKNLDQISKVNGHIAETLSGIHMVKAYAREKYMEDRYKKQLASNFKTLDNVNRFDAIYAPLISIIKGALITVVVVLSSDSIGMLGISLGAVAASVELITNLFQPIDAFGMEIEKIQRGRSGIAGVDGFLSQTEETPKDKTITMEQLFPNGKTELRFSHLSYRYPDGEEDVLSDLDFPITQGSHVAFTGRTGVGKTTLFRLVLGLIKPTTGRLTLGNKDVHLIPNDLKRKIFGSVEQQFIPVEGTLLDQISLHDETITQEACRNALRFVGLDNLEPIGDEPFRDDLFSQGEKQLLSIARAIVTDPPILLFDEITAALDAKTEERLSTVLKAASKDRTLLSISHRESSIRECDTVIRIEKGRIIGIGNPDEMLRKTYSYS